MLERPAIEYNLTEHCNLTCHGCNHASPLFPKKLADLAEFERDLTAMAEVMRVREMRIVGGEPTLHPQLLDFLRVVKRVGMSQVTVLYTNGVLLHRMPAEMWELIDELFLSQYVGGEGTLSLDALKVVTGEYGVKLRPYDIQTFQVNLLNQRIDDPALVKRIYGECKIAHDWSCHAIYEGRFYKCATAPFFEYRLGRAGVTFSNKVEDSIAIHGNPNLRAELEAYIGNGQPLKACDYCLGTSGPLYPHRLMTRPEERVRWLQEDHSDAIADTRRRLAGP